MGVFPDAHLDGVSLLTPVFLQKSDCFQSNATSAAANSSGLMVASLMGVFMV